VLYLDDRMLAACGCTHNDTEGLINLPLTAREIQAVVFFRVAPEGSVRVSMRSKYDVDVRLVATAYGGGGHDTIRVWFGRGFVDCGPGNDDILYVSKTQNKKVKRRNCERVLHKSAKDAVNDRNGLYD
jgi:hypothetical protein